MNLDVGIEEENKSVIIPQNIQLIENSFTNKEITSAKGFKFVKNKECGNTTNSSNRPSFLKKSSVDALKFNTSNEVGKKVSGQDDEEQMKLIVSNIKRLHFIKIFYKARRYEKKML